MRRDLLIGSAFGLVAGFGLTKLGHALGLSEPAISVILGGALFCMLLVYARHDSRRHPVRRG